MVTAYPFPAVVLDAKTSLQSSPLQYALMQAATRLSSFETPADRVYSDFSEFWLREMDLNHRPSGYEPNELPDCSIPQNLVVMTGLVTDRIKRMPVAGAKSPQVLPSEVRPSNIKPR
jgi:hypothetical protein